MDKDHGVFRLKEASVVLTKLSDETLKTITPKKCQMLEKNICDKPDSCCDGNNTEQVPQPFPKPQTKRRRQRKNTAPRKVRIAQDPCNDDNSSSEDWIPCRSADDTLYPLSLDIATNKCFPFKHELIVQCIGGNNNANTSTKDIQNADKDTTEDENPQISTTPIFVKKTKPVSQNTETYIQNLNKQPTNSSTEILQTAQPTRTDVPILLDKVTKHKTGSKMPNILSRTKTVSTKPSGSKHMIKKKEAASYVDIRPKTAETTTLTAVTPIPFSHIQNKQSVSPVMVRPLSVAFPILHKQICNQQPFLSSDSKTRIHNLVTNQPFQRQADQSITVNQFPTSSVSSSSGIKPSAPKPHYRSRLRSKSGTQYIVRKDSIITANIADILEPPFRERVQECGQKIVLNKPDTNLREKLTYINFIKKSGSSDITHGRIAYDEVQSTSGLQGPPVKSQSPIIPTRQKSPVLNITRTKTDSALVEQAESIRVCSKGGLDDVKREMNKVNQNTWIINENISGIDNIILPMYINSKRLTEKEKTPTEKFLDNLQSRFMPAKETSSKQSKSIDKTVLNFSNRGIVETFDFPSGNVDKMNNAHDSGKKQQSGITNNLQERNNVYKTIKPKIYQTKCYPASTPYSEVTHGQKSCDITHSGNEKGHLVHSMDIRQKSSDTTEAGQGPDITDNFINTNGRTEPGQPKKTINIKREGRDVSKTGTTDDTYRKAKLDERRTINIKQNDFTKIGGQPQFTNKLECIYVSDFNSTESRDQQCYYAESQLRRTDKINRQTIDIKQEVEYIDKQISSQFIDITKDFGKSAELNRQIKNEQANSFKDFQLTGNCRVETEWPIDISKIKKEPAERSDQQCYDAESQLRMTDELTIDIKQEDECIDKRNSSQFIDITKELRKSVELNKQIKIVKTNSVKDFQLVGNCSFGTEWLSDMNNIKKEPVEKTGETAMEIFGKERENVSNFKLLEGNEQAQANLKREHNCHDHAYTRFEQTSHLTTSKKEDGHKISAAETKHTKCTKQSTDYTQKPQTSLSQLAPIPVYAVRYGEKVVLFPAAKATVIPNDLDIRKLPPKTSLKTSPTRKERSSTKKRLLDPAETTQSDFVKKLQLRRSNETQPNKSVPVVRDLVNVNFRSIVNEKSRNNMKHMCAVVVQITRYEDKFSFTKGIIALSFSNGSNPFLIRWHNDGIHVAMVTFNGKGQIQHLNVDRISPGFYSLTLKNDHGHRKNRTYEGILTSTLPNEDLLYAERDFLAVGEIKNIMDPTIPKPDVRNFIGINLREALSDVLSSDLLHAYSKTISDRSYRPKVDGKMWYSMDKFEYFTKTYGRKRGFQPINRFHGEEAN